LLSHRCSSSLTHADPRGDAALEVASQGTYIDLKTLAFAIHHVLQDDTEVLVKHLSAYATGKRE
jgi:hypothetical protein